MTFTVPRGLALLGALALVACGSQSETITDQHAITGTVSGASAVTVNLTGAATKTTTTDGSGGYAFAGLADGAYTVTAVKTGYTFAPASVAVTVSGAGAAGQDLAATPLPHAITGTVGGASAVTVNLTGAATKTATTDANGGYAFTGLADGAYTVTPAKAGYTFTPTSLAVTVAGADVPGQDFLATPEPHAITGTVSGAVSRVAVYLTGASSAYTMTDTAGHYAFAGLADGDYTVTPSHGDVSFTPVSRSVTLNGADLDGQDFTAARVWGLVSGTVSGAVRLGVTVRLGLGAQLRTTRTDAEGGYAFSTLTSGQYTVFPSLAGYAFAPPLRKVKVSGAVMAHQDFVATTTPCPGQDLSAPSVPAGVRAGGLSCMALVTWGASTDDTGVVSYLVYRTNSPVPHVVLPGTALRFNEGITRPPYPLNFTICYQVSALDCAGHESARSASACVTISWRCGGI